MNKLIALLIKLPGAIVLGMIVALGLMQNDPWLKDRIERLMISTVTDIVGEVLHVQVDQIDLLRGEVVLKGIAIASSKKDWSFESPTIYLHVSWLSWFKGNGFDTAIRIDKPQVYSRYDKELAIADPFYALVNAPFSVPLNIVSCTTEGSHMTVESSSVELAFHCASYTSIDPLKAVTTVRCNDGYVVHKNNLFAEHLQGKLSVEVPLDDTPYTLSLKLSCIRPSGGHDRTHVPYHLYYHSKDEIGTCTWRSEDGLLAVQADDIITTKEGITSKVTLTGHLGELASFIVKDPTARATTGTGTFTGDVEVTDEGYYRYKGNAQILDAAWNGITLTSARLSLEGDDKQVKATIADAESSGMGLRGSLSAYLTQGEVTGALSFARPYEGIPHCVLEKGRTTISYKNNTFKADFKAEGTLFKNSKMPLRGSFTTDFKTAKVRGTLGGNSVHADFAFGPFSVTKLSIKDPLHMRRLSLDQYHESKEKGLEGIVDGTLFKKLMSAVTGYQLTGSVEVRVRTCETPDGTRVELQVADASLKIPGTYTVIKEVSGVIDFNSSQRCVIVNDLLVTLHKGSAWSSRATFCFDEEGTLVSAHVPMQCKGLLISKQKELFGTISGGLTAIYDGHWKCTGLMTIENAHVRSNLLSSEVQRDFMQATSVSQGVQDIELDVRVQSRTPLKVQTSFLTTDAHLAMHFTGSASRPDINGTIELAHGSFDFPYKPLFVTQGTLTLAPHQPDGPTISLTAKNKIRAYTVTMRVSGTVLQPQVTFESTPQLSEEGIITLLLAGSDHGSLSAAMPRMLMNQFEDVIFGSEEKLSAAQQFLKSILTPLKNVRLIPKGSDQEELQAVVEVDINDRLRAKAQNNLQLTDETQLELEYVVSDDVTVKAVRDQTGSVGGEVEMRWKF